MTYEEFKEIFEDLTKVTLTVKEVGNYIVFQEDENILLEFNKHEEHERYFTINTARISQVLNIYDDENYNMMWEIIFDLIDTPAKQRLPIKKYYAIKLDLPEFLDEQNLFLNKFNCGGKGSKINYTLDTKSQSSEYQTQFTLKEIEGIIPKEDMNKFKIIPVEEED